MPPEGGINTFQVEPNTLTLKAGKQYHFYNGLYLCVDNDPQLQFPKRRKKSLIHANE